MVVCLILFLFVGWLGFFCLFVCLFLLVFFVLFVCLFVLFRFVKYRFITVHSE